MDKSPFPLHPRHQLAYLYDGIRIFRESGDEFFPESQFLEISDKVAKEVDAVFTSSLDHIKVTTKQESTGRAPQILAEWKSYN